MEDSAVVVFTSRGVDRLIKDGGSGDWVLNNKRASECKYVVCVQNRGPADNHGDDWGGVSDPHKSAFFIGKISKVVLAPEWDGELPRRWLIAISQYATVSYPDMWSGARNPVAYSSLSELGIDEESLKFIDMPYVHIEAPKLEGKKAVKDTGITIKEAKILLSKKYDVAEESIDITIRA